jgi:hypothetical protein
METKYWQGRFPFTIGSASLLKFALKLINCSRIVNWSNTLALQTKKEAVSLETASF